MTKFNFIKYSYIWLILSGLTVVVSVAFIVVWGLKMGIDFTGGSLMELEFSKVRPADTALVELVKKADVKNPIIQKTGDQSYFVRSEVLSEAKHQEIVKSIKETYEKDGNVVIEKRFEMIGASVSNQLRQRSMWAIIMVCLGIIAYVAYAFRGVTKPVASWKFGLLAIVAAVHDVVITIGFFALLGYLYGTEVDVTFVIAILTVLGYSINDTIVIYDRVREKLIMTHNRENFGDLVNEGLNQTVMRSINTTLTTVLPLIALALYGGSTIHSFVLALLVGVSSGAYSSIFVAAPLLAYVEKWQTRKIA